MTADENIRKPNTADDQDSWQKSVLTYLHDLVYMLAAIMLIFLLLFLQQSPHLFLLEYED